MRRAPLAGFWVFAAIFFFLLVTGNLGTAIRGFAWGTGRSLAYHVIHK